MIKIKVEEIRSTIVLIDAVSEREAAEVIMAKYEAQEFNLSNAHFCDVKVTMLSKPEKDEKYIEKYPN